MVPVTMEAFLQALSKATAKELAARAEILANEILQKHAKK
jgi:hypothetical protein